MRDPLPDGAKPGVLVADDDPQVRRLLAAYLGRQGLAVWTAGGGDEAVELYRRHRDAIGVVLLDVIMPGRDGPATLAALRRIDPGLRAAFMTADSGGYSGEELLAAGAERVFRKPFTALSELAEALRGMAGGVAAAGHGGGHGRGGEVS